MSSLFPLTGSIADSINAPSAGTAGGIVGDTDPIWRPETVLLGFERSCPISLPGMPANWAITFEEAPFS